MSDMQQRKDLMRNKGLEIDTVFSKIPKEAKLVFKGKIWEVYQWKEKMFDGKEGVFEGLRKRSGVKIFALSNDKLFMTKEEQPGSDSYYSLIGGTIEGGELPIKCAKRELLEEAGMESDSWMLLQVIDVLKYPRLDSYVYLFIAKDCKKVSNQKLDPGEKITIVEVSFNQFVENMKQSKGRIGAVSALLNDPEQLMMLRSALGI